MKGGCPDGQDPERPSQRANLVLLRVGTGAVGTGTAGITEAGLTEDSKVADSSCGHQNQTCVGIKRL